MKFTNKPELHEKGEIRKAGGKSWQLPKLSHFCGYLCRIHGVSYQCPPIYNLYIILLELCIATRKSPESLFGQEAVAKQRSALGQCVCHHNIQKYLIGCWWNMKADFLTSRTIMIMAVGRRPLQISLVPPHRSIKTYDFVTYVMTIPAKVKVKYQ